jgi:glyoxylase-like metal-dependent hydrolase (beta-lactamase superfamily II)/ferredoxin
MANPKKRLPENVAGRFFVDSTCINCDTCRQLAPTVFGDTGEFSFVQRQPADELTERQALRALLACPTGSIGAEPLGDIASAREDFPLRIEGDVYYCGFNSPKSYGGNSYFVRDPGGNWLIDSPKFLAHLVKRFEEWGGVERIFLSHRDDVADAERYAEHFKSQRIIHELELDAQPGAEIVLRGQEVVELSPGFKAIPTPGHTAGHCVLLVRDRFLFTGDHLDWDRETQELSASRDYCWDSWPEQKRSLARLLGFRFEWVLPGHGQRVHLPFERMHRELAALVQRLNGSPRNADGA